MARYQVMNEMHGTKKILPSEACKDKFFKNCKLLKNGQPEWRIIAELPDEPPQVPQFTKAELLAMLAAQEEAEEKEKPIVMSPPTPIEPATPKKKKAGRPKKSS